MISFHRVYLADAQSASVSGRAGRRPVRIRLSLTGPVSPLSGMIVNLVEIDQKARALIALFEQREFKTPRAALEWLRDQWILTAERLELRAGDVALAGKFGRVCSRIEGRDQRRTEWEIGSYAVDTSTGHSGRLWVRAATRATAAQALRQLRQLPRLHRSALADVKLPTDVFALGFRERKTGREFRREFSEGPVIRS